MVQDPNGMIVSAYDGDTTNNEWCPTRSTSNIVVGVVSSGSLLFNKELPNPRGSMLGP